jgi:hypothetical protein
MLPVVLDVTDTTRPRSLPWAVPPMSGADRPRWLHGPPPRDRGMQRESGVQPVDAAPGAAPQPVAGGIAPGTSVSDAVGEPRELTGVTVL